VRLSVRAHSLVSIVGAGGLGKTRLALQVAADMLPEFPGGVWLVELADLDDGSLIPDTIASALELKSTSRAERMEAVLEHLQGRNALVILENCEHLRPSSVEVATRLLAHCPDLRLLVTSRRALGTPSEHVFELGAMSQPDAATDWLQEVPETATLFLERASAQGLEPPSNTDDLTNLSELCRLLEGNPLAVELAAARVDRWTLKELVAHVREQYDALGELDFPSHDRQRSLRTAIEWSHQLLTPNGQRLFARLSVFRGGASRAAVDAVAADPDLPISSIDDALTELMRHYMISRQGEGDAIRFSMLDTLRSDAARRLREAGNIDAFKRLHAAHYLEEAIDLTGRLSGPEQIPAIRQLHREHANLRTALEQLIADNKIFAAMRMAASLRRFWATSGHFREGRYYLQRVLSMAGNHDANNTPAAHLADLASAYYSLGTLETRLAMFGPAEENVRRAIAFADAADNSTIRAKALNALGLIAWRQGDVPRARSEYLRALEIMEMLEHPVGIATALNNAAIMDLWLGDYWAARHRLETSLEIAKEVGNQRGIAEALNNLAGIVEIQSDYAHSRTLLADCLAVLQRLDDRRRTPMAIANLAHIAMRLGRLDDARELCDNAIRQQEELDDSSGLVISHVQRALIALDQGDLTTAKACAEMARTLKSEASESRYQALVLVCLGEVDRRRGDAHASQSSLQDALELARRIPDQLTAAHALHSLGRLAFETGEPEAAAVHFRESLGLRVQLSNRRGIAESLEVLARTTADGPVATQMLAAASTIRDAIRAPLPPVDRPWLEQYVADLRAQLGDVTWNEAWELGRNQSLSEVLTRAGIHDVPRLSTGIPAAVNPLQTG